MILNEMCGWVVEDAKFLFIFVRVSAAGRALPATLAWWILWRRVNYSSSCWRCTLSFLKVRGVEEVFCPANTKPLRKRSNRVMSRIEDLAAEWHSLQPIAEVDQRRLNQKFMLEFNYNSNHLEGNTLTYGQTEFLLLFGKVVDGADMHDLEEMKASNVGLQMVMDEALNQEHHLTEYFIRTLHKTLLREDYVYRTIRPDGTELSYTIHAGQYKTRPNSVRTKTGEMFEYASPEETPALMKDLLEWYVAEEGEGRLSPIELASLFHYRYIRIHPFEDGNGRISRLIVNYILRRHGYPMIVVGSDDKDNYLDALNRCDVAVGPVPAMGAKATIEQIAPFVQYLSACLEKSLETCIKAGKGEDIEEPDDFSKRLSLFERSVKKSPAKDGHVVTAQDKADVFNLFHRKLAKRVVEELSPVRPFFNVFREGYYMSKNRNSISPRGFFTLESESLLDDNLSLGEKEILKDAQSIYFRLVFEGVKNEYNLRDVTIRIEGDVLFDLQSYSFAGKSYQYGTYPSEREVVSFIKGVKDSALKQLSGAVVEG